MQRRATFRVISHVDAGAGVEQRLRHLQQYRDLLMHGGNEVDDLQQRVLQVNVVRCTAVRSHPGPKFGSAPCASSSFTPEELPEMMADPSGVTLWLVFCHPYSALMANGFPIGCLQHELQKRQQGS